MPWDVSSWFKAKAGEPAPPIVRKMNAAYLQDVTNNQYDAVGFGSPEFIDGTIARQAVRFDGIDDYFAIQEFAYQSSSLDHALTVEARVRVDSGRASEDDIAIIAGFGIASDYWRMTAHVESIGGLIDNHFGAIITLEGVSTNINGGDPGFDGTFKSLAFRYDPTTNGGQVKFFVDGSSHKIVDSLGTVWGGGDTAFGAVGTQMNGAPNVFNDVDSQRRLIGDMEYLRVWHVARTDAEISSFYNTTSLDTTSGLQLHYNMEMMGDISHRVTRWPTLRRHWSDIRPQAAAVTLANDDGALNDFLTRPPAGLTTFAVQVGFGGSFVMDVPNGSGGPNQFSDPFDVSSGELVEAWCHVKPYGSVSDVANLRCRFYDASSNIVNTNTFDSSTLGNRDWQVLEGSTTVASGEVACVIDLGETTGDGGYYYDNVFCIVDNDRSVLTNGDFETGDKTGWGGTSQEGSVEQVDFEELITPFVGRLGNVSHSGGAIRIAIDDKVSQLSDIVLGTVDSHVTYTDSTLPSEMVWDWLTNHADFSDIESTSNPDIDYTSFSAWAGVFSDNNVVMNGNFDGQKITEALRKMSRYTQSAIYMEGGKIFFSRFTAVNTETTDVTEQHTIGDTIAKVDILQLVTKQTVLGGFNVGNGEWDISATHIDSADSISYGLHEEVEKDENIWYTTSTAALDLAQRFTLIGGNPYEQISTVTNLRPIVRQVGETINFNDDQLDISKGYRIMEMEFNINNGTFTLGINASQTETPFVLDQSELDSDDKLL